MIDDMGNQEILNKKEKELIYLGASIASGCRPCKKYHLRKSSEAGLTDIEINRTIALTISIRNNATHYMESLSYNRKTVKNEAAEKQVTKSRNDIFVGIAATYAVNFTSGLDDYIGIAKNSEFSESELGETIKISKSVIEMARAHSDMVADKIRNVRLKASTNKDECSNSCNC